MNEIPMVDLHASFSDIASKSLFFIDKSEDAYRILHLSSKRILILRPPLFGKSVMMDMVENILQTTMSSFQSLHCSLLFTFKHNENHRHQVIRFKLSSVVTPEKYEEAILEEIKNNFRKMNIRFDQTISSPSIALNYLFSQLSKSIPIAVLIDDIQSILVHLEKSSKEFKSVYRIVQSIFDVLIRWKSSIAFMLLLGTANFFDLTDLVTDFTYHCDAASIFGFNHRNIILSNKFNNQVEYSSALPSKTIGSFGNFHKNIQEIFSSCFNNFDLLAAHKLGGQIRIDFLFHLFLHFGGYRFSPDSTETVVNPIDFVLSITKSHIDSYWASQILNQVPDKFKGLKCIQNFFDASLSLLLCNRQLLSKANFELYKILVPFGLLSFDSHNLVIPNLDLFDFYMNQAVERLYSKEILYRSTLTNLDFKILVEEFEKFVNTAQIPKYIIANDCYDFLFLIFCRFNFHNMTMRVAKDGTFLVDAQQILISLCPSMSAYSRLLNLEKETPKNIAVVKITGKECVTVESAYRIVPYRGSASIKLIDLKNRNKEHSDMLSNPLVSFQDLVYSSVKQLGTKQKKGVAFGDILVDLLRKRPQFATHSNFEKSIEQSLFDLEQQNKITQHLQNDIPLYRAT